MELWVRSQDKAELVKATSEVMLDETIENEFHINVDGCYSVGKYETKERALQILDEIQEILFPDFFIKMKDMKINNVSELITNSCIIKKNNYDIDILQRQSCVYEMPKE